jgi:hypothetical protein
MPSDHLVAIIFELLKSHQELQAQVAVMYNPPLTVPSLRDRIVSRFSEIGFDIKDESQAGE